MSALRSLVGVLGFLLLWVAPSAKAAADLELDGRVIEVQGDRIVVSLEPDSGGEAGRTIFFYRHYAGLRDEVTGQVLSGHTWLGSAVLEHVDGGRGIAQSPFLRLEPGDLVKVAPNEVLRLTDDDGWIPQGLERQSLRDPFLQKRRLNNRIQVLAEYARMGTEDHYYGSTVDFTYWPMMSSGTFKWVEALRFGLGAFQGLAPGIDEQQMPTDPELVRFLFGFAEFDLSILPYLNLLPMVRLGLNNQGFGVGGGFQVRVGSPMNSHILVGADYSRVVGGEAFMELHLFPMRTLQFFVRAASENLPAGGERGGKARVGAEYQINKMIWARAAVGLGGRSAGDARDRGLNGELGLSFNFWTGGR